MRSEPQLLCYLMRWLGLSGSVREFLQRCNNSTHSLQPLNMGLMELDTFSKRFATSAFEIVLQAMKAVLGHDFLILHEVLVTIFSESDVGADERASSSRQRADLVVCVDDIHVLVIEML